MAGPERVYFGGSRRHRYMTVEESSGEKRTTTSSGAVKWAGLAAVLVLSAVLVGCALKTISDTSSSNFQQLRDERSSPPNLLYGGVAVPVRHMSDKDRRADPVPRRCFYLHDLHLTKR